MIIHILRKFLVLMTLLKRREHQWISKHNLDQSFVYNFFGIIEEKYPKTKDKKPSKGLYKTDKRHFRA